MVKLTTNYGIITIDLFPEKAPITVANFESYVRSGHYDGAIFHRVIDGFMIQGGGFAPGMKEKTTLNAPIQNEANNGLKNKQYTVAMARTPEPHSASAQFFINLVDKEFLDFTSETPKGWGYAVFGVVAEGQDIVEQIGKERTGSSGHHQDVPKTDIVIEKAEII